MNLFAMDTDTITHLEHGHPNVCARVRSHPQADLYVTVITVQEILDGWHARLPRAKQPAQIAHVYQRLQDHVQLVGRLNILPYDVASVLRFEQLLRLKLNIGKMDLRIAAIALEHQAILVTCNKRDFQRVPGLIIEDWTL
jgi:tRNA(fMet)-specific endonuclease VapC